MEYIGHTVNFGTYRKSYKQKKQLENDPDDWVVSENIHEPIIDQETFETVQRLRENKKRLALNHDELPIISELLVCAD